MANFFKCTRRLTSYIILLTSSLFLLNSCQEGGEAGDLLGQWRLADTEANYMNISGSVVWLRHYSDGVYGNFQHVGDSLFIQCYSSSAEPIDTAVVEDSFGFKPFNNIRLKIETLDSDRLVLSKGSQTWSFNKY